MYAMLDLPNLRRRAQFGFSSRLMRARWGPGLPAAAALAQARGGQGVRPALRLRRPQRLRRDRRGFCQDRVAQQGVELGVEAGAARDPELAAEPQPAGARSEERRVGKEWRARWAPQHDKSNPQ